MDNIEFSDIQGLVFSGYGKMPHASYHPLKISQSATPGEWLKALLQANKVTHGAERKTDWCLNIAFTQNGLKALKVHPDDLNETFEIAFVEGMNSERRQKLLQDNETSSPSEWLWGNEEKPVDLILMIFCKDKKTLEDRNREEQALYHEHGLSLVTDNPLTPAVLGELTPGDFRKEHFGFSDGISQPVVEDFSTKIKAELDDGRRIAAGEFVLGYQNEYQLEQTKIPEISSASAPIAANKNFGKNGTYLVFRQLQQNVPAFWNYFKGQASDSAEAEWLAAKCVGRWPSGVLINATHTEDPGSPVNNNFDYAEEDPYGQGCPLGSHVRRSNPRAIGLGETPEISLKVVNRHRIIRRGRSYGELIVDRYNGDKKERGLFFLCINANIERQFEFIQHTWINNVKFNGLYDEKDPVIGSASEQDDDNPMSIPGQPIRKRLHHVQRFVTTRGGAYFFLPGLQALRTLAGL